MSNIIKINVTSLDAKSLLTDPSIVVLDTKHKLMLSNISINLDSTNIDILESAIHSGVTILGVTSSIPDWWLVNSDNLILLDSNGSYLIGTN